MEQLELRLNKLDIQISDVKDCVPVLENQSVLLASCEAYKQDVKISKCETTSGIENLIEVRFYSLLLKLNRIDYVK